MRPLVRDLWVRWFAVLGGPAAYVALLVVGFWLVPVACRGGATWALHLTAAACAAVVLASLATAVVLVRGDAPADDRPAERGGRPTSGGRLHLLGVLARSRWLALAGLVLAAVGEGERRPRPADRPELERRRLMAQAGVALGVLSVILVVFHWVPALVIGPCA